MAAEDDRDSADLGEIGRMGGRLAEEHMFWRLVCTLRLPPSEVDGWTLPEMRTACAYLDMSNDYRRVWGALAEYREGRKA